MNRKHEVYILKLKYAVKSPNFLENGSPDIN